MVTTRGPLQLTLALCKPDVTRVPHVLQAIHQLILKEEFFVVRHKEIRLKRDQTEKFYAEHRGKFFYNRLVTFMARKPDRICQVSSCKESLFDDDPHTTCIRHALCTHRGQFSPCIDCLPILRQWKKTKSREVDNMDSNGQLGFCDAKYDWKRPDLATLVSGPTHALILAHEDAIKRWRSLMGPTKVYKTKYEAPDTIRGMYGLTDTRNSTHGSDSPETAAKEIAFFFPEFSIEEWHKTEEPKFRKRLLKLDPDNFIHRSL